MYVIYIMDGILYNKKDHAGTTNSGFFSSLPCELLLTHLDFPFFSLATNSAFHSFPASMEPKGQGEKPLEWDMTDLQCNWATSVENIRFFLLLHLFGLVSTSFSSLDDKGLLLAIKCHLRAKMHLSRVCPASSMGNLSNAGRRAREGIRFKMA